MLLALVPLIQALIGGATIEAAAAALTGPQWIAIGTAALQEAPEIIEIISGLHGLLADVLTKVIAAGEAIIAPDVATAWLNANATAAMQRQPGIVSES